MRPLIAISVDAVFVEGPPRFRKHALNEHYVASVLEAGGLPWPLPNVHDPHAATLVEETLDRVDGLLLSGGDDVDPQRYGEARRPEVVDVDPVRDAFELALARRARARGLPTLLICRGLQVANVAFGGTLLQDIPSQVEGALRHRPGPDRVPPSHDVDVVPGTRLEGILGVRRLSVNSYHHQSPARLAPGLVVAARAPDGVIEGLEDPTHPFFLGVQWHPERSAQEPSSLRLFAAFLAACRGGA